MKFYTLRYLLTRLEEEGLPHGRRAFLEWEARKIIPKSQNTLVYRKSAKFSGNFRIYTEDEVKQIVEIVKRKKQKND